MEWKSCRKTYLELSFLSFCPTLGLGDPPGSGWRWRGWPSGVTRWGADHGATRDRGGTSRGHTARWRSPPVWRRVPSTTKKELSVRNKQQTKLSGGGEGNSNYPWRGGVVAFFAPLLLGRQTEQTESEQLLTERELPEAEGARTGEARRLARGSRSTLLRAEGF